MSHPPTQPPAAVQSPPALSSPAAPAPAVAPPAEPAAPSLHSGLGLFLAFGCGLLLVATAALVLAFGTGKAPPEVPDPGPGLPPGKQPVDPEKQKINRTVERGLAYLKAQIQESQEEYYVNDPGAGSVLGVRALAALTLLECGLPAADPAVQTV